MNNIAMINTKQSSDLPCAAERVAQAVARVTAREEPLTMSSREIAALTGKQHKDVLRDIRKMLAEINERNFAPVNYLDAKGQLRPEYHLSKRETLILVSGYNIGLRARIIDRWAYLEETLRDPSRFLQDIGVSNALLLQNREGHRPRGAS